MMAGCDVSLHTDSPTATLGLVITVTHPPSPTLRLSETPLPPPPTPTVAPIQGTTSTQLNVRAAPSTASEVLGIIWAQQSVQIIGQGPGGNWWQIFYEASGNGKGWVTAQYVETAGKPDLPVIGGEGSDSGNSAVINQQLNIRGGPGTSFGSIGILNTNDVVDLTGKNKDGSWLQIDFPTGPDGKGWVNATFVKADSILDVLPIISDAGEVVGTGTPMNTPPPPTLTIVPAPMDFDSAKSPTKTILFDRVGTQTLIYNGEVSKPNGDSEDWIAFRTYGNSVLISIRCVGNGSLQADIASSNVIIACNETDRVVPVQADIMQLIHIEVVSASASLQYTNYTLIIKASQ